MQCRQLALWHLDGWIELGMGKKEIGGLFVECTVFVQCLLTCCCAVKPSAWLNKRILHRQSRVDSETLNCLKFRSSQWAVEIKVWDKGMKFNKVPSPLVANLHTGSGFQLNRSPWVERHVMLSEHSLFFFCTLYHDASILNHPLLPL